MSDDQLIVPSDGKRPLLRKQLSDAARLGNLMGARALRRQPMLLKIIALLALTYVAVEWSRPSLLLVGNVTVDVVDGKFVPGGAVTYAAVVAAAHGQHACIVTAAGPDADLSALRGHSLHVIHSDKTLTFEHTYTWWGNRRKLRVTAQPNVSLSAAHVPWHCRRARTIVLGPLTATDVDVASFLQPSAHRWPSRRTPVALMAQGLQRSLEQGTGRVVSHKQPSEQLTASLHPGVTVFLSDVETDPWAEGTLANLSQQAARIIVTRGEQGADEHVKGRRVHHHAYKVDAVVDTNGAGDTFAMAYVVAEGWGSADPAGHANWAGSRAVQQPQTCKPQCTGQSIGQVYGGWLRSSVWALVHRLDGWRAAMLSFFPNMLQ